MVLVRVQISPSCPKCDKLLEKLMEAGIKYGFEVMPEIVDKEYEVWYTRDLSSKIHSGEWIAKHGSEKQKRLYKKAKPIFDVAERSTHTPVIEIRWFYGIAERSLVIRGFRDENLDLAIKNLLNVIMNLIGVERKTSTPLGFRR